MNYLLPLNLLGSLVWAMPYPSLQSALETDPIVVVQDQQEWELAPGESKVIIASFIIKDGYHIQADKVSDENLIPTSIKIESSKDFKIKDPVYPVPEEFLMTGVSEPLLVFSGVLEIRLPVKIYQLAEKGLYAVECVLRYQACDSRQCLFPRELPFTVNLKIL
jgi:Thiol:disulfide interchange protein DsbD, N-terminal